MKLFNRKVELSLQVSNNKLYTWSNQDAMLNIAFNVSKSLSGIGERATITVYGLSLADINYLCTVMRPREGNPYLKNYIKLKAGYNEEFGEIFKGGIYLAEPEIDNPNMSVTLNCIAGFQSASVDVFTWSQASVSLTSAVIYVAKKLEAPVKIMTPLASKEIINNLNFKCTPTQALMQLRNLYPKKYDIFYCGGIVYLTEVNQAINLSSIHLEGASGLIGTPKPTIEGVDCTSLLRPYLQAGTAVSISSKRLPFINGNYKIVQLTHEGESRGNSFYSQLKCVHLV